MVKFGSRWVLLAVLVAGGVALLWSFVADGGSDEVTGSVTTVSPDSDPGDHAVTTQAAVTSPPSSAPASSSTTASPTTAPKPSAPTTTFPAPEVLAEVHPQLVDIDGWLQSEVSTLEELRGQVVVVEFWTFACYNCKNRIPYTQDLYAKYRDRGLEIVGIHSPEFKFEEDVGNISEAMAELGVTWPVVLDTRRRTFWEWQTGGRAYWPRTYVLDRQGRVRYDHIGEGKYRELDQTVAFLLQEEI